jgi:hypothetical protein
MRPPIPLSDVAMATLMQLASPLAVEDRGLFLRDIAARLQDEPAIGDGVVIRIAREAQRRYLKPVEPVEIRRAPMSRIPGTRLHKPTNGNGG